MLGVLMKNIYLTYYGTIEGLDKGIMDLDKFFNELEINLKSDNYNVIFDDKLNSFVIKFNGEDYIFNIDKSINNYNPNMTVKVQEYLYQLSLMDSKYTKNNENIKKQKELDRLNEQTIIENADKGIFTSENDKIVYIKHLKKEVKKIRRKLFKNQINILKKSKEIYLNENNIFRKIDLVLSVIGLITSPTIGTVLLVKSVVGESFILIIALIMAISLVKIFYCDELVGLVEFIHNYIEEKSENKERRELKNLLLSIKKKIGFLKNKKIEYQNINKLNYVNNKVENNKKSKDNDFEYKDSLLKAIDMTRCDIFKVNDNVARSELLRELYFSYKSYMDKKEILDKSETNTEHAKCFVTQEKDNNRKELINALANIDIKISNYIKHSSQKVEESRLEEILKSNFEEEKGMTLGLK